MPASPASSTIWPRPAAASSMRRSASAQQLVATDEERAEERPACDSCERSVGPRERGHIGRTTDVPLP